MSRKKNSISKKDINNFIKFANKYPVIAGILIVLVIGLAVYKFVSENQHTVEVPMDGLYVHYIDVGQGDSELICCDGEFMLIDGGEPSASDALVSYLKKHGVKKLDYLVCTHAHADHCGGLDAVVESFDVETVFTSPYSDDNVSYSIFLEAVEDAGLEAIAPEIGESFSLGEAGFRFIGPLDDYESVNDDSLVMRLEYGDTSFLFTGDMSQTAEHDLINDGAKLRCDVLKVGHHGSYSSTCYQFLREARPEIAVISCATGNSYGHPHDAALSRLNDAGATVYRTDLEGSIVIFSDGMKVERKAA